ncbi:MAG: DUF488 family protein [Bacteroidota bacterium]
MKIAVKRVYDVLSTDKSFRVLVDRLWPRGLVREKAKIDLWLKEIAPSDELRRWFHQNLEERASFKKKYFQELKQKQEIVSQLKKQAKKQPVTLLYSSKNEEFNNAAVLKEYLEK